MDFTCAAAVIGLAGVSALFEEDVQTTFAGLAAAAVLLGCATAGFGWLRRHDGRMAPSQRQPVG